MSEFKKLVDGFSYIEPNPNEGKSVHGSDLSEKLLILTNKENAMDVYGNSLLTRGDEDDKFSDHDPLDPAALENPDGGSFAETGVQHCDTCGVDISAEELAAPSHLGHNLRYSDSKQNYDIGRSAGMSRQGGSYFIGPDVVGNDLAYAPKPLEEVPIMVSSSVEAVPDTYPYDEADKTVAM